MESIWTTKQQASIASGKVEQAEQVNALDGGSWSWRWVSRYERTFCLNLVDAPERERQALAYAVIICEGSSWDVAISSGRLAASNGYKKVSDIQMSKLDDLRRS